ncbi:cellulose binding domain-containing protein [Nocardioides sp. SR21]|uniref:cellulose binding domain-containing protein n=1 Tax=Nocardioides sp. SR21 TaxID=2919501 RepID=UPI001FAA3373|nr:cellulose binding domain-containing protein [Nocardioides sp. SR21]
MRRLLVVAIVLAAVLAGFGTGVAIAAFTARESNPQTITAADPAPPATLVAQSRSNDAGATSSQIQLGLRLVNRGATPASLGTVTMRYWFTADGADRLVGACYYSVYGCGQVGLSITDLRAAREGADHYLQVSFSAATLAPGQSASLDQLAVRDDGGTQMTQADDWSFADRSAFADNARVTVYVGGQLVWGTEPGAVPVDESFEVRYLNRAASPLDNAILPSIKLAGSSGGGAEETGNVEIDLRRVTVRYWFTKDSTTQSLIGFCDYAQVGCDKVALGFVPVSPAKPKADTYLEITFTGGVIPAEGTTGPFELRVHKADYSNFDETNDYSWGTNTTFEPNPRITAYLDGKLVWGTPP